MIACGVAKAFSGGRAAHPEDQNEEEDEKKWGKIEEIFLSCPPGIESLDTALMITKLSNWEYSVFPPKCIEFSLLGSNLQFPDRASRSWTNAP